MATRAFNPEALSPYAAEELRAPVGVGALVWRYTVFVPLEELRPASGESVVLADPEDLESLRGMLVRDFVGLSVLPPLMGSGLRDPGDAASLELNKNLPYVVYARPIVAADRYFERLQQELQEAFDQGLVLVERQEVFLLGQYREARAKRIASLPPGPPLLAGGES